MATVSVEVDLDDIDTDDLVSELSDRIRRTKRMLNGDQKAQLIKEFKELAIDLQFPISHHISIKSLDDKMKLEHLTKVFEKYTSADIERMLP